MDVEGVQHPSGADVEHGPDLSRKSPCLFHCAPIHIPADLPPSFLLGVLCMLSFGSREKLNDWNWHAISEEDPHMV